jgi:hypothetical protein
MAKRYDIKDDFDVNFPAQWKHQTTNHFENPHPNTRFAGEAYVSKRHFPYPHDQSTYN